MRQIEISREQAPPACLFYAGSFTDELSKDQDGPFAHPPTTAAEAADLKAVIIRPNGRIPRELLIQYHNRTVLSSPSSFYRNIRSRSRRTFRLHFLKTLEVPLRLGGFALPAVELR
jgi:hypothetical protein